MSTNLKGLKSNKRDEIFRCLKKFKTDRKSTRLNSSHANISYAVFCLKKKKTKNKRKKKKKKKTEKKKTKKQ